MPSISRNRLLAFSLLLINSALWGFAVPIIKYSLQFTTPPLFLFYRYILATIIFFPIFLIYKARNNHQKIDHLHHITLALLGTPLTLLPLFYGLSASTSIESSILESSAPIFVILGGLVYLKEKFKPREWLGVFIAISGTVLLITYPLFFTSLNSLSVKGNLLIITSNIFWAAFLILSKKNHTNPIYLCFYSFLLSIPFFLFLNLANPNYSFFLNPKAIPGVLYMTIGGSIIAFWAYIEGQKLIAASEAAIFSYLKPVFTIPLAYIWLKEPFTPIAVISTIVILTGVYISEKR